MLDAASTSSAVLMGREGRVESITKMVADLRNFQTFEFVERWAIE